jgi:hypothetical protein
MIKSGYNPQQLMLSILETQMKGSPMGDNLINLARQGNTVEIEKIARNLTAQKGIDFDKEFNVFRKNLGI